MGRGPIAERVLRAVRRVKNARVVDLAGFRAGGEAARALQQTASAKTHELHPVHAYWSHVQHQLSILAEQVLALPQASEIATVIAAAEDEYMPSGPPMSPLTGTYFFGWAFCDLQVGPGRETGAGCILAVVEELGIDPALLAALHIFAASRMGLWVVAGHGAGTTVLEEAITGERREAVVPAGHAGRVGELWFVRVLPPPIEGLPALVFTTPYVLLSPRMAWGEYLERSLRRVDPDDPARVYPALMKHGLSPRYWPEFVFEAYAHHKTEAVFLLGLPDVDGSRPHGKGFVEP